MTALPPRDLAVPPVPTKHRGIPGSCRDRYDARAVRFCAIGALHRAAGELFGGRQALVSPGESSRRVRSSKASYGRNG